MGDEAYVIVDWDKHFECAQSRKHRRLQWVSLPTKHDGLGYRRVISGPNGAAIYGAWCAIVGVAAKCPIRGVLAGDTGPLDASDLSTMTGLPEAIIAESLQVLTSPKVRWLAKGPQQFTSQASGSCLPGDSHWHGAKVEAHDPTRPDPTRHNRTLPDPTNDRHTTPIKDGKKRNKKITSGRGLAPRNRTESGRKESESMGTDWCQRFVVQVVAAMGSLSEQVAIRQRRPLYAAARALMGRDDRDRCREVCVEYAASIRRSGGADNPWAVWQKRVGDAYPETRSRKRGS